MNVATERAREACDGCRRSHKKCAYDDNSTRCLRCEKKDLACSLFLSETTAVPQQVPPPLMAVGSTPESWAGLGTPNASSASSNFSPQFPSPDGYYWPSAPFTGNTTQEEYLIFQSTANQHESEQPAMSMNQGSLYGHHNVYGGGT
ncbi:hypothetical protein V8E55_001801 [Tylopilus felleus]